MNGWILGVLVTVALAVFALAVMPKEPDDDRDDIDWTP